VSVAGPEMPLSVIRVAWPVALIVMVRVGGRGSACVGVREISETVMSNMASVYSRLSTAFIFSGL
jgi:hypothetical protein